MSRAAGPQWPSKSYGPMTTYANSISSNSECSRSLWRSRQGEVPRRNQPPKCSSPGAPRPLPVDVGGLFGTEIDVVDRRQLLGDERRDDQVTGFGEMNAVGPSQHTRHLVHEGAATEVAA